MSRRAASLCLFGLFFAACGGQGAPTTPTGTPELAPPLAPVPTPPTGQTAFSVGLPIRLQDFAHNAYGLNPFGVHLGDHGTDGHPGWDFEYVPGANVYAAAAGTVQSVLPNGNGYGWGIQITHSVGSRNYRTIYGVGVLAPDVSAGSSIAAGQPVGTAAVYTFTIGTAQVTFGMTHFQVDDFSRSSGQTNMNAVPPETFLDAESRRTLDQMFQEASYGQEIVEPFLANTRDVTFPQMRTWILQQGDLAARIDVTRASGAASEFSYVLRDATGAATETGRLTVVSNARPFATIDFQPASGGPRRGVYDIVGETMTLSYGSPGASRPSTLTSGAGYRTQ